MMAGCADVLCNHSVKAHGRHGCQHCDCPEYRTVMPRSQQLQRVFGEMSAAGMKRIPWTDVPDPTAEKPKETRRWRGVEVIYL